jgi:hypothetical protein
LFARLLAEEYQLWLAVSGDATPAGDRGSSGGCERAGKAIVAPATRHGASGPGSLPEGNDR